MTMSGQSVVRPRLTSCIHERVAGKEQRRNQIGCFYAARSRTIFGFQCSIFPVMKSLQNTDSSMTIAPQVFLHF